MRPFFYIKPLQILYISDIVSLQLGRIYFTSTSGRWVDKVAVKVTPVPAKVQVWCEDTVAENLVVEQDRG